MGRFTFDKIMKDRKHHKHRAHNKNEVDRERRHEVTDNFDLVKVKNEPLSDEEDRLQNKRDRESHRKPKHEVPSDDEDHRPPNRRDKDTYSSSSSRHHPYKSRHGRDSEAPSHSRSNGHSNRGQRERHNRNQIKEDDPKDYEWGKKEVKIEGEKKGPPENKAKPDFGLSGKLAEETNTYNGVVIKYSEPPEARKPKRRWRFYPFKGDAGLPTLHLHRQSAYLIGRDRNVADIPIDHPSCSKQHAAFQYRLVPFTKEQGTVGKRVRPYIIDLESANGTYVNNNKIDPKKYVELLEKDVVKFGYSSREYVLLHEHSKDSDEDDDM